jgi:hypothetical protein
MNIYIYMYYILYINMGAVYLAFIRTYFNVKDDKNYTYIHVYICMYICIHICILCFLYIYIYVYMYICIYVYKFMYT